MVVVALVAGLALLASRARGTARDRSGRDRAVLTDETVSASELRARAEQALAEGRHADAVVDGFRALARRQVERGRLDDSPGDHRPRGGRDPRGPAPRPRRPHRRRADLFDAVMYGERPASRDQAVAVLDLETDLASAR